jgi:hypothetical protein
MQHRRPGWKRRAWVTETAYLEETALVGGGGNAAAWMEEIQRIIERNGVKIRIC